MANPTGMDISSHNANINWPQVKGAIDFVFVKRSEGTTYLNPLFPSQWDGAKSIGLLRGAYHFFRWDQDPTAQALFFIRNLGTDVGELPCTVDIENTGDGAGPHNYPAAEMIDRVRAFIDTVKVQTARDVILYTYPSMWRDTLGNPTTFTDCPLWVASYTANPPKPIGGWGTHTFWQYSSKGSVRGVPATVDVNLFNGTYEQLQQLAGINPHPDFYTDPVTGCTLSHGFYQRWLEEGGIAGPGRPITNEQSGDTVPFYKLPELQGYTCQLCEYWGYAWKMGSPVVRIRTGALALA